MAILSEILLNWCYDFLYAPNPRERYLVKYPWLAITVIIAYIMICLHYGPAFMKNRKPFNIKPLIIVYDIFQVAMNAYLFTKMAPVHFTLDWSFHCPEDWDELAKMIEKREVMVLWHLYLLKFLDLLDTIFFILRKKQSHVSVLHVLHHVAVASFTCYISSFNHRPLFILVVITINTFVHMIMYAYYGLATIGISLPKFKRIVTSVQIGQFVLAMMYMGTLFASGCFELDVPNVIMMVLTVFLFSMFVHFYRSNFLRKTRQVKK